MAQVRLAQRLLVALFVAILFAPGIAMLLQVAPSSYTSEKRKLAEFPQLASTPITELPRRLDDYVRDHFGFRDALIRWSNRFRVKVLRTSPVRNAIIGHEGWLFYAAYGDGSDIRDHLGRLPLTLADIEERKRTILEHRDFFASRGITYLFVVVPNKQSIYPGWAALRHGTERPVTRLDQISNVFREDPSIPFLDLREALLPARSKGDLYLRTDSHWNMVGTFLGFQAILRRLAEMRPGIPVIPDDYARFTDRPAKGGDVATLLSMADEVGDVTQDVEWNDTIPRTPLRVVLAGDSFAESLHPFFEQQFEYVNPMQDAISRTFDVEAILTHRPDIVIEEHVERYLTTW